MLWELIFLVLYVVLFLGAFYTIRWGSDKKTIGEKDNWKITNHGGGGGV